MKPAGALPDDGCVPARTLLHGLLITAVTQR